MVYFTFRVGSGIGLGVWEGRKLCPVQQHELEICSKICISAFQIIKELNCFPEIRYSSANCCSSQRNVPWFLDKKRTRVTARSLGKLTTTSYTFSTYLMLVSVSVISLAKYFAAVCRRYGPALSSCPRKFANVSRGFSISRKCFVKTIACWNKPLRQVAEI